MIQVSIKRQLQGGYALITLLVFMTTALIVTSAAVVIIATNSKAATSFVSSEEALAIAEAGADQAVLGLLRNQNYTGETFALGSGQVTITVTGSGTKTIVATGTVRSMVRKIQVNGSFNNTVFTVSSWREVE